MAIGFVFFPGCDPEPSADSASGETSDGAKAPTCAMEPQGDSYVMGLEKTGEQIKVALLDSNPAPPYRGNNVWRVSVTNLVNEPLVGLDLEVSTFMPQHRHGSPVPTETEDLGEGVYVLDPVNLFMAGLWEITVTAQLAGEIDDSVTYSFCVD